MMKKWHPDQNQNMSHNDAVIKLEKIKTAFNLLGNTDQTLRIKYDESRNYQKYESQGNLFAHLNEKNNIKDKMSEISEKNDESIKFRKEMKAKQATFNYHGRIYNKGTNIGFETQNEKKERESEHNNQQNMFTFISMLSYLRVIIIFGIGFYFVKYNELNRNIKDNNDGELTDEDKQVISSLIRLSKQDSTMSDSDNPKNL